VKQTKILLLIVFSLLGLVLASCIPGGSQPAQGWAGTVFYDDILYVGSMDGKVMAVNSSTRNLEWSYTIAVPSGGGGISCGQTPASAAIYGTPAVDGDLVYVGTYNGRVMALSTLARSQDLPFPQKRNEEWEWVCPGTSPTVGGIVGSPVVREDAIYVTSSNGSVYSLDKETGDPNWKPEDIPVLSEKLWTTPVVEGDVIYVSTFDGHIYTLSTEAGNLLPWNFEAEVGFVSSPMLYEDTIFVGSFNHELYAIKIGSDKPLWKFSPPGGNWFWATPVVKDGVVYAGCLDGKIYAITAETGEQLWGFDTESPIVSSPVLVDDLLVVAAESGDIYVFDTNVKPNDKAMMPVKSISIDVPVRGSLCVQEGVVYVRAQDNCLYALDIEKGWINWKLPLTIKKES